jgi:4-hydroxy-3-polyprenylbenzoate decarboxylase
MGMYRMQVFDARTTGMHWHLHKDGREIYEKYGRLGVRMPVSVAIGCDPATVYASTAPLPKSIDELLFAGYLRRRPVPIVKCITNDLYVPYDSDIVIEGYVDPSEDPVWEGPFGDHTGFYSLADWYPRFHVTCITHAGKAVYPATVVGIPPQEDAWFAYATEKLFLSPLKVAVLPEILDFHMPEAGTAHNLMIVKIEKSYPGQGMKVISSLSGAGQMMFTKYIVAVNGDVDIRNYKQLAQHVFRHADFGKDIVFSHGPLDVLDHASDSFSFGGKAGVDATIKLAEERQGNSTGTKEILANIKFPPDQFLTMIMTDLMNEGVPVVIISVNMSQNSSAVEKAREYFRLNDPEGSVRLILAVDHTVDVTDLFQVMWQVLANTDPVRDHTFLNGDSLFIDGTAKIYRKSGFARKWPNVVCSYESTISSVDSKWSSLGLGRFLESPSRRYCSLCRQGNEEIHPL